MPAASICDGVGDRVRGGLSAAVHVAIILLAQRQHWSREPAVPGCYIQEGARVVEPEQFVRVSLMVDRKGREGSVEAWKRGRQSGAGTFMLVGFSTCRGGQRVAGRNRGARNLISCPGQLTCVGPSSAIPTVLTLSHQSTLPCGRTAQTVGAAESCVHVKANCCCLSSPSRPARQSPTCPSTPFTYSTATVSFAYRSHVHDNADAAQPSAYTPSAGPKRPSSVIPPPTRSAMATCQP